MHTNDHDKEHVRDSEHPGYETTDINVVGIIAFLGGLSIFVLIFFVFCFGMGKVINTALEKQDGPGDKWHQEPSPAGGKPVNGRLDNLASNPKIQQEQLQALTEQFPQPRLQMDDGEQDVADLHAREDLLLEHYSYVKGKDGVIRIPIEKAMEMIAAQGLPVAQQSAAAASLTGAAIAKVHAPLTSGFARTGFEQDTIEEREQKMKYTETAETK